MSPLKSRQRGAALIFSLLMFWVLTMVGLTGMQSTVLDEKIAGNFRDTQLAFHAAESALRDAETLIETMGDTTAFDGTSAFYGMADTAPAYWTSGASGVATSTGYIEGLSTQPTYSIQIFSSSGGSGGELNMGGYGGGAGDPPFVVFRIIARGRGQQHFAGISAKPLRKAILNACRIC